ncbi:Unknown protein, partial [Striga hermonthica]
MVFQEFEDVLSPAFEEEEEPIVELFEVGEGHTRAETTLELKKLPKHLKYVFLDDSHQKPAIIYAEVDSEEEEELISMLRKNQKAIGWSLGDIKGISPTTCMHRIILEDGAKPFRDSQRRLNPNMMEVVKKKVLKLFSEGLIYPVASSEWVSPIHVVPKKGGITVIENDKKELVPTRITTGWRMCIDYRRLNAVTKKDHFPLPFIDQILDRLSGHQFYCFLDGLSGYYQIALGNGKVASGMLDLGAGINLMPFSIFQRLGLGDLRPTHMCLQLADRSIRYPKGIVEDVLVKVGKLIIPVDFVILDVGDVHENGKDHTILLGRPFMATTNTLIDVKNGTLNMTVLGESVSISVREAMSSSLVNFIEECAFIDVADPFVDEMVFQEFEDVL